MTSGYKIETSTFMFTQPHISVEIYDTCDYIADAIILTTQF